MSNLPLTTAVWGVLGRLAFATICPAQYPVPDDALVIPSFDERYAQEISYEQAGVEKTEGFPDEHWKIYILPGYWISHFDIEKGPMVASEGYELPPLKTECRWIPSNVRAASISAIRTRSKLSCKAPRMGWSLTVPTTPTAS